VQWKRVIPQQKKDEFMASINYADREISVKIVYYGPGLSGKTTNLQVIHRKVPPEYKSDMVSLATETDRTLFFDFLPLDLGKIKGFATKFQLYTVPGQVYYNATRKLVLRGVDGVVFVADSAPDKMQENLESFQNLEENLAEYGYKRETVPIILQYNKRDLPNALPIEEINRQFNKYNLPVTEAVANKGIGVFDALKLIGKIVIDYLNKKYSRPGRSGASESAPAPMPQRTQYPPVSAPSQRMQQPQQGFQGYQQPVPPPAPRGMNQQSGFSAPQYQQPPQQMSGFQQPMSMQVPPVRQPSYRPQQSGMQQPVANPQQIIPTPSQLQSRQFTPPAQQQNFQRQTQPGFPQQGSMRPPAPAPQQYQQPPMQPRVSNQGMQQPSQPNNPSQYQRGYQNPANHASADPFSEEVSFEPQNQQSFEPRQQQKQQFQSDEFYNYGNVNLNQQQFNQNSDDQQEEHFELQSPSDEQAGNNMSVQGNKTDLDMEIEKYQREIEEKQRRMRMQGQSPLPAQMPQQRAPEQMQSQNANQFGQEQESDYDVYNMEISGYQGQNQPPTQRQPAVPASDNDDDMYFTSIDTDKQRKPIRKPLNPRTQQQQQQQQQKGFFSKFFNGNNREMP
jgi:signal recognition particle receptor subunit beta